MDKVSISETEPLEVLLCAVKSSANKSRYLNRLNNFFDYFEIQGDFETQRDSKASRLFTDVLKRLYRLALASLHLVSNNHRLARR